MRRLMRWLVAASLLGMLVPVLPVGVVVADDAVVDGDCLEADFDAALATALDGGGTITFDCGTVTSIDFNGVKTITAPSAVVIDGGEAMELSGQDLYQLFNVEQGATLELRGITLVDGFAADGGAIQNSGTLRVVDSAIASSAATNGSGGGGAVYNTATGTLEITNSIIATNTAPGGGGIGNAGVMTITGSMLIGNWAPFAGGALLNVGQATINTSTFLDSEGFLGAAILNAGTLNLSASTLHYNEAFAAGGGIYNLNDLTVTNSTFSDNRAPLGGAVFSLGGGTARLFSSTVTNNTSNTSGSGSIDTSQGGTVILRQTIVADQYQGLDCFGPITSQGYNLDSDDSCELAEVGDISGGDAQLGPLDSNGGLTQTHMPALSSDAVDAGGNACPATDQRGMQRPQGAACEIGSVELQGSTMALCMNRYTGALTSTATGVCPAGMIAIQTPSPQPLTFCISRYTGEVTYSPRGTCAVTQRIHVVPDNGDLLTCVSRFTGKHRWVTSHASCTAYETPNTIWATL